MHRYHCKFCGYEATTEDHDPTTLQLIILTHKIFYTCSMLLRHEYKSKGGVS
jgi:hypothetical protein